MQKKRGRRQTCNLCPQCRGLFQKTAGSPAGTNDKPPSLHKTSDFRLPNPPLPQLTYFRLPTPPQLPDFRLPTPLPESPQKKKFFGSSR
ncbi:hypothetical protein TNCV_3610631 [Trichonephila clavipes]|nr:hypothetical protein TNCV_3610631 [Trichonephila clavipes]